MTAKTSARLMSIILSPINAVQLYASIKFKIFVYIYGVKKWVI